MAAASTPLVGLFEHASRTTAVVAAAERARRIGQNPAQTGGMVLPASRPFSAPSSGAFPFGPSDATVLSQLWIAAPSSGGLPCCFACARSALQHCFRRATFVFTAGPVYFG